jgi:uncharacterized protein (TIGR00290 family)
MMRSYMNWSGGKDSSLCLHRILGDRKYQVDCLLTSVNSMHNRISMHGVRRELLEAQANSLGIPLDTVELPEQPAMKEYEQAMKGKTSFLKSKGCDYAIFGDIFLEDLRRYREQKLDELNICCVFPLWKISTRELMKEFLELGYKGILVCINEECLDKNFCGRLIDKSLLNDLPENVDVCGENGEYHSYVYDGPIFRYPIHFHKGETVYRRFTAPENSSGAARTVDHPSTYGFYFCDLLPE